MHFADGGAAPGSRIHVLNHSNLRHRQLFGRGPPIRPLEVRGAGDRWIRETHSAGRRISQKTAWCRHASQTGTRKAFVSQADSKVFDCVCNSAGIELSDGLKLFQGQHHRSQDARHLARHVDTVNGGGRLPYTREGVFLRQCTGRRVFSTVSWVSLQECRWVSPWTGDVPTPIWV